LDKDKIKKKRGRPKKNKEEEKMILVNKKHLEDEIREELKSDELYNIEYEELVCEEIVFENKKYLKDKCSNKIYSMDENNDMIGIYDNEKKKIEFF